MMIVYIVYNAFSFSAVGYVQQRTRPTTKEEEEEEEERMNERANEPNGERLRLVFLQMKQE